MLHTLHLHHKGADLQLSFCTMATDKQRYHNQDYIVPCCPVTIMIVY